jgi:Domain of unknown function (DUF6249)
MSAAFWLMIAVLGTALFAFISVVVWIESRQKERETHYRDEMSRRIAEAGDSGPILEYVRENAQADAAQVRMKARVAGLINMAVGVGLMIFLNALVAGAPVYLVGLIPLLIGVVLLIFSELMMRPGHRSG